jgi:hypothetical protein
MSNLPAVRETNGLVEREETTGELQQSASEAAVVKEIEGALIVAKRFPRDEDRAYQAILRSSQRFTFAEDAQYSFPRGGEKIQGPSIYFAREFARLWGNIRHGCDILFDDETRRTIRAWAWDLQTNVKVHSDDAFQKLIFRKRGGPDGKGGWIVPDERDLRELTNRRAAIAKRNCILELLPSDMIQDAISQCEETVQKKVKEDPDAVRKAILKGFGTLNVTAEDLKAFLGTDVAKASPAQLAELRKIYKSIADGQSTWSDYQAAARDAQAGQPGASRSDKVAEKLKRKAGKSEATDPPPAASTVEDLALEDEINDACTNIAAAIDSAGTLRQLEVAGTYLKESESKIGEMRHAGLLEKYQARHRQLAERK